MEHQNLLGGPPATMLPEDPATAELSAGADPATVAAAHPGCLAAWAALAELALAKGEPVAAYAYARTGYHRGLDQLRRAGWRGHGPVPWEHEPNRGFLRSLHALGQSAAALGEEDEAERCRAFLRDASATARRRTQGLLTTLPRCDQPKCQEAESATVAGVVGHGGLSWSSLGTREAEPERGWSDAGHCAGGRAVG